MRGSFVTLGRVGAHYGIKGWVKVHSYTRPAEEIFEFTPWVLRAPGQQAEDICLQPRDYRGDGRNLRVVFAGLHNRDDTAHLIGCEIGVDAARLPKLPAGQYYWRDLIGLEVIGEDGVRLGVLSEMMETGANDVAVVRDEAGAEILIPWIADVVARVELEPGRIMVNWGPED